MSLFRILLMQQEKYKDATHWITVGYREGSLGYHDILGFGRINPEKVFDGFKENPIRRLFLAENQASYKKSFTFMLDSRLNDDVILSRCSVYIKNLASNIAFTCKFTTLTGFSSVSITSGSPVESFFTADDIGKTIPLKIEITGSSGSGPTQPTKPDPGLM